MKKWIVEVPHNPDLYSVDGDLEKYLNSNPHPDHELFQVVLRGGGKDIYVVIWKLRET